MIIDIILIGLIIYCGYRAIKEITEKEDGMKWIEVYDRKGDKYRIQVIDEKETLYVRDNFFGDFELEKVDEFGFKGARDIYKGVTVIRTRVEKIMVIEIDYWG